MTWEVKKHPLWENKDKPEVLDALFLAGWEPFAAIHVGSDGAGGALWLRRQTIDDLALTIAKNIQELAARAMERQIEETKELEPLDMPQVKTYCKQ